MSKEVLARHGHGEIPKTVSRKSACWDASLRCLCSDASSTGNKLEELGDLHAAAGLPSAWDHGDVVGWIP